MPIFDRQASSKRGIMGPYFWIYCALAIPLTALVLGAWAMWIRVIFKRHEKEDNEVRARGFLGLISEKSNAKGSDV
jgi:hypothetical protein